MSIPKSVIEAADSGVVMKSTLPAERRARRVIRALAKDMPDDAVDAAQQELSDRGWLIESPHLRAAIMAALNHVAGEK